MWSGIVLLQNQITLLHKRDCNRTQDLIPIPYCGHIARNNNQLWFYPVSNASPDHNGATPKPIPFDNTVVGKAFSATSVHTTSTICAIESELDSSVKRTRLHCLIGNSLGACAVNHAIRRNLRAWVRGRPTYGRRARRPISRNRLPTVFGEFCRLRPDRGRSAKCPVSLKRLTRRSIVETLTPKWLATCCCLWPYISNAIALPSEHQSIVPWLKKVQSSVKMKRKIGKRIEERCVSLKCTKWCEEILCWRFKHACFARNFGFPYCPILIFSLILISRFGG